MMPDTLTTRLLAEIERQMTGLPLERSDGYVGSLEEHVWTYLAALRTIVGLHRPTDDDQVYRGTVCCIRCCAGGEYPADDEWTDTRNWPCPTIAAIAEALDVTP